MWLVILNTLLKWKVQYDTALWSNETWGIVKLLRAWDLFA